MSASKRDFTDFNNFPGHVSDTNIYEFPQLRHIDSNGRMRIWTAFVRIIRKVSTYITGIDWDLEKEKYVPIKDEYFTESELPSNYIAEAWIETGILDGKITRHAPTYFTDVTFEGNSNQRNQFQTALIYARAQFLKQQDKGKTTNKSGKQKIANLGTMKYFPMLAKKFKDGEKHIKYPVYVQPKLDGVRCLIYLDKANGNLDNVVAYSRNKNPAQGVEHICKALLPYLRELFDVENNQSIYFDGELYKHGKKLQDISGEVRSESKNVTKNKNEYHIYDCFYPMELDTSFETRKEQLEVLFNGMNERKDTDALLYIKPVPTLLAKDMSEINAIFDRYTKLGYEGVIIRNINGEYMTGPTGSSTSFRSNNLVKMKKKESDEFVIVGYTQGDRGKDKGALIWIAVTAEGHEFNVTPKNMTYEQRYAMFKDCEKNFDQKYKGKLLTVEYEDLSKDKIPQRAKALVIRDYE